jgi:GNAT superfamily N-acetyltransferase
MSFEVDRLRPEQQRSVVAMLARAFYEDPLFRFFVPDPVHQTRALLGFMSAALADARPFGEVHVATTNGSVASAALWLPPEGYPRTRGRDAITLARSLPMFVLAARRVGPGFKLMSDIDRAHHELTMPHYYLAVLGTDPLFQRAGAGSAVLRPVLDRAEQLGLPAYLETQKEANLAFYSRHGFELVDKLEVAGCPPIWTMLRQPR